MSNNVDIIQSYLMTDPTLVGMLDEPEGRYTGIIQGGIWTRRLKREPPGHTPYAFYVTEKGKMIRSVSAVIVDAGDSPHAQRRAIPSAYTQIVPIYLYASATATGKLAIKEARQRIYDLIVGEEWRFQTEDGPWAFLEYVDRTGILDSEDFSEAVYDTVRYRITSRIRNEV